MAGTIGSSRRRSWVLTSLTSLALGILGLSAPAFSQCGACSTVDVAANLCVEPGTDGTGTGCGGFPSCQTPVLSGPTIETIPQADGNFTVRLRVGITAPRNHEQDNSAFWPQAFWYSGGSAPPPGSGNACLLGQYDKAATYIERQNVTCAGGDFGTYSLRVTICQDLLSCAPAATRLGMDFQIATGTLPGCDSPPPSICPEDQNSCSLCTGPQGASSPAGGGPGLSLTGSGPGARLRFASGGAGFPTRPGGAAWAVTLGRGWSHEHTERIVPDPDETHVWLITRWGTFRELSGLSGGVYTVVHPSGEYRKLTRTASGWDLHELDGTVHSFDASGFWTRSVDRDGNTTSATYSGGQLTTVSFPDGRSETYTYQPTGKLATITEVGVGGAATRTWTYTWSGDHLTGIARPDGTAYELHYDDARFPDEPTRLDLVGTDSVHRVEAAWEYDGSGNVARTWKGDVSATGPNAVEVYTFSYTNPLLPTQAMVTDPLGKTATYTIGRDTGSRKPKLLQLDGDCPVCATGPNTVLAYGNAANPLLPTQTTDGRGLVTQFAYNANGRMTSKTEAAGTPLARTTTYQYGNSAFPAFVTEIDAHSTAGGSATRTTVLSYNATGDLTTRTLQGAEAGSSFNYATATTFNAAGQPLTVDPPGYGTADVTSYTYDSARGNLLPLTRTDPIVGTTTFGYDSFNRRTQVTDPNGVSTVTAYDDLNRVTSSTGKGAVTADDLVTAYEYTSFGDLLRTTLPRGNLLEYGYDAAGRLVSIEKKPDAVTHGERTFYTLDGFGNRTEVDLQHWNGSTWVTDSTTQYVFNTRCHPDKVINADGTVTEYAYDCDGNLSELWDANHPSNNQTNPATDVYSYDELNRTTSITQPWGGAGGGNSVTAYTYDIQDHLASVTDAEGNATTYATSDRDLVTQEVSNVSGTTMYAYNEHGQRVQETDARPLTTLRTYDALDRLMFIDYPDPNLDTTFAYDDPGVSFSKGRLTSITRGTTSISYAYDRFGRMTQDGALTATFDKNGNRLILGYPAGVTATYTYDFADRQATLQMQDVTNPVQTLVSASSYESIGPLASLTLGNGLTETHAYSNRYLPSSITVGGLLSWSYGNDNVGNPTSITDTLNGTNKRTYAYQDGQYFLTTGNGPWGTRSWTYDKIGNRLTETRGATTDTYTYLTNGAGGHKAQINQINGTTSFSYDALGDVLTEGASTSSYGDDRRLARTGSGWPNTTYHYDGRGFLSDAIYTSKQEATDTDRTYPTYDSQGLFLHRSYHRAAKTLPPTAASNGNFYVFYFAGRPVATLDKVTQGSTTTSTLRYLSTDHLGTPILLTSTAGAQVWQGGFEPFGTDYNSSPTILRFPGQWSDSTWNGIKGYGTYYNVNRWYKDGRGRFAQPDPLGIRDNLQPYIYVDSNPMRYIDPLGLSKITNNSCVEIYIKDENSSTLLVVKPGESGDGDGFYNSSPNSCSGFCGRGGGQGGPAPEVYKINDWTDVTISGGCNGGCLDFSTSGPISWASNILDPRTGWRGSDFLNKHPDWPKPPKPPKDCCSKNWK
jgi:RHS repeat-associated protein